MNVNESTQKLQEAILEAVDDYAREQALTDIGTDNHSPETLDEAIQYVGDIADDERIFEGIEKLIEAIMYKEYRRKVSHYLQEWSGEKAREATHESMRGAI